jgi:hypothetical protein
VVGGVLAGIALTAAVQRLDDRAVMDPSSSPAPTIPASAVGSATPTADAPPGTPAPDPRTAVDAFCR